MNKKDVVNILVLAVITTCLITFVDSLMDGKFSLIHPAVDRTQSKTKTETEQVSEYLTSLVSTSDVLVKNINVSVLNNTSQFDFLRWTKFNDYAVCEHVTGTIKFHTRNDEGNNLIQIDRINQRSIPCVNN